MVRLAVDVWAPEYEQAKDIALAVQGAMAAAPVVNWFEMDQETVEDNYFQIILEYTCQQKGGFEK
jgi:hypothetical protein